MSLAPETQGWWNHDRRQRMMAFGLKIGFMAVGAAAAFLLPETVHTAFASSETLNGLVGLGLLVTELVGSAFGIVGATHVESSIPATPPLDTSMAHAV